MPRENESAVLDSARVHLTRLTDALERGTSPGRSRRTLPRLIASLILASVSCAGCVGYSYISNNLDSLRRATTTTTDGSSQEVPGTKAATDAGTDTATRVPLTRNEEDLDEDNGGEMSGGEEGYGDAGSTDGLPSQEQDPDQDQYQEPAYPDPGSGADASTDPDQDQGQDQDPATSDDLGEPAPEDPTPAPDADDPQEAP